MLYTVTWRPSVCVGLTPHILALMVGGSVSESLGNSIPVDDLPDGAKVFGLAVLILEVVGVLPGINSQKRLQVSSDRVLVGAGDNAEGAGGLVLDEPSPPGALDTGESSVGLLLEGIKGAKIVVDSSEELALGLTTTALAVGGEVLPEQAVVDVTTAVEVDKRSLSGSSLGIALVIGLGEGLDGGVEAVDVGLMVLGVVEFHDLAGNVRLEGAVIVCDELAIGCLGDAEMEGPYRTDQAE